VRISADPLDFGFDLRAQRRRRLRRFLRIAIPIVTLLTLVAAIAGIGAYLYQANREGARVLTDDLLEELERRIVSEVENFLEPASLMVRLAEEVLEDRALFDRRERLAEPLAGAGRPGGRRGNGARRPALPHVAERIRTGIRIRELNSVGKEVRQGGDVWRPRPLKFGGIGTC
jgi:hypothetical protein